MSSVLSSCIFMLGVLVFVSAEARVQDPNNLKEYILVIYIAGEDRDQSDDEIRSIQTGHLKHLADMAETGLLSMSGPFSKDGEWRGLLVFNTSDTLLVKNELNEDPAVKAGRLNYQIHQFYSTPGRCLE